MPEYNYGFTAPLKNALDYLHDEWHYKAVGFVSYGGIAAGTRAMQLLKPVLTALKLSAVDRGGEHPVRAPVHRRRRGLPRPTRSSTEAAGAMLDELLKVDGSAAGAQAATAARGCSSSVALLVRRAGHELGRAHQVDGGRADLGEDLDQRQVGAGVQAGGAGGGAAARSRASQARSGSS